MIPLVESDIKMDMAAVLERKMIRARALHKELNRILEAEYVAGMANDPKSLSNFLLRKKSCVNRFETLVRAINEQLQIMIQGPIPSTMSLTLVNLIQMVPGLTQEQAGVLCSLARDLEKGHSDLLNLARRNGLLFKRVLDRLHAASSYANQGRSLSP